MTRTVPVPRALVCLLALFFAVSSLGAASQTKKRTTKKSAATTKKVTTKKSAATTKKLTSKKKSSASAKKAITRKMNRAVAVSKKKSSVRNAKSRYSKRGRSRRGAKYVAGGPWTEPTYADSTVGDQVDGEDLAVRLAAVNALGPYNGTVVVTEPETGRVLTVVNQRVAFGRGYQPCSTVKIYAALAGLNEGIIDRHTAMRLYGRTYMNLTDALARSNNPYFANIGVKLGYEKIAYYSRLYGLGEKAVLNADEEEIGTIPAGPPANGGMGMMTSFGEGIKLTPLQLAATLGAVANGGTLYHLQYPRSQEEVENFVPQVKRHIPMQQLIPEVMPGLLGATEYGTARRAYYDPNEPIFGKTGTCTDRVAPIHLGWFGSFNEVNGRKLVVVVLLTGGRPVNGPVASGIAGQIYRELSQQKYFARDRQATITPVGLISGASW